MQSTIATAGNLEPEEAAGHWAQHAQQRNRGVILEPDQAAEHRARRTTGRKQQSRHGRLKTHGCGTEIRLITGSGADRTQRTARA